MKFFLNNNYFFVTCKTIAGNHYFENLANRKIVLNQLLKAAKEFKINFDAFSIATNHYHLLFYLNNGNCLPSFMQKINGVISYQLKNLPKPIWQKYCIRNITTENSFYKVQGYILGNPLKHGLVKNIDELENFNFCNYSEKIKEFSKEMIDELIMNVKNLNWE